MYKLGVDISEAQMKRLHKGHKVRVKKGKGVCLVVRPNTYNMVSRAFSKNKGSEIQLTPEEIQMNKVPQGFDSEDEEEMQGTGMHGCGPFDDLGAKIAVNLGRLADKGTTKLENMIGEGSRRKRRGMKGCGPFDDLGAKIAVNLGRLADKGTTKLENMIGEGGYGFHSMKTGRGRGRPMKGCGPFDDFGANVAGNLSRLSNSGTDKLIHMIGNPTDDTIRNNVSQAKLASNLNEHLGTNYGYLNRAGLDNALAGMKSAAMSKMGIDARYANAPTQGIRAFAMGGHGMPPPSRMVGGQIERASVGRAGGMLSSYTPPALVSQPFSANFQFQHFLPPQYQHFNTGGQFDGSGFH